MTRPALKTILLGMALLAVIFCAGCAPKLTVQSNLDPEYRAELDRVFIVLQTRQLDEFTQLIHYKGGEFEAEVSDTTSFRDYFLEALDEEFAVLGVEWRSYRVTGLELSDTALGEAVAAYGPDAVLVVDESHMGILRDPGFLGIGKTDTLTEIDLDVYLYEEYDADRAVWRATLSVESGYGGVPQMVAGLAQSLAAQLVADGLIPASGK